MNQSKAKIFAIVVLSVPILLAAVFNSGSVAATPIADDDDAAVYKAKCAMCHSPKAEKAFDPAKTDEEHVKVVLEGKKGEKPPYMPAFKDKGIDEAKAKSLVTYMRSLRTPPAE